MKRTLYKAILFTSLMFIGVIVSSDKVEAEIKVAPGTYCTNGSHGWAKCSVDYGEVMSYTGQVIVNGWINYGPWQPRPGIGVIIP